MDEQFLTPLVQQFVSDVMYWTIAVSHSGEQSMTRPACLQVSSRRFRTGSPAFRASLSWAAAADRPPVRCMRALLVIGRRRTIRRRRCAREIRRHKKMTPQHGQRLHDRPK